LILINGQLFLFILFLALATEFTSIGAIAMMKREWYLFWHR
jgi:hypothetical protein